jgi:hypothetical protein
MGGNVIVWCSHCPPAVAQMVVLDRTKDEAIADHIATYHPGSGDWVEGDDWEVLGVGERGELSEHLETITP